MTYLLYIYIYMYKIYIEDIYNTVDIMRETQQKFNAKSISITST